MMLAERISTLDREIVGRSTEENMPPRLITISSVGITSKMGERTTRRLLIIIGAPQWFVRPAVAKIMVGAHVRPKVAHAGDHRARIQDGANCMGAILAQ